MYRPTAAFLPALLLLAACQQPFGSGQSGDDSQARRPSVVMAGSLHDPDIVEASGLARSRRHERLLWVINDGDAGPEIHAIDETGADRGRVEIVGARNVDWEDLASFELDGRPYLVAADIGDNAARRDVLSLYFVEEPVATDDRDAGIELAWRIDFRYPDGPRDAESIAVDGDAGLVYVLSKRDVPPVLYTLPLSPAQDGIVTAQRLGTITSLPEPTRRDIELAPRRMDWHWQPTGIDISADGTNAAILTYRAVYVYTRKPGQAWLNALNDAPAHVVGLGNLPGAESISFGGEAGTLFVTIEKRRAPLLRIDTSGELPGE